MKNKINHLSFLAISALLLASCGRHNPYGNYYGYNSGGNCGAPIGGAIVYSERGVGTAVRNGVPATLDLTIYVDQQGRVGASGSLQIPDAGTFFSEGMGMGNPYLQAPIQGPLHTCVGTNGPSGGWDDYSNQTVSPLTLNGGIVQIQMAPGMYVSSNGLFVQDAAFQIRGYSVSGSVTFTPGGY